MRTSIISFVVSGFIALSMAACSGASSEPVDQSAQAERAGLAMPAAAPAASASAAAPASNSVAADSEHPLRGHRGPADPAQIVKRFDKNADGTLQVSELPPHLQQFMGKADTNNDGVLTVEELKAGEDKMRAEHLAKVDTNHDGKISPEERKAAFERFAQERFAKLDKNSDGALSKDEVGDKRWERLSVADADKNGSVTEAEIRAAVANGTLKFPRRAHGMQGWGAEPGAEHGNAPAVNAPAAPAPSTAPGT